MATTTRREEYSSNIIRSLHPTTTITTTTTSATNKDLNENIDYLLDDLQHSVTGASQYLGSRNVQHLCPANTTTYIKERSISPGRSDFQNENRAYKTSSYQYSTSSAGGNAKFESSQNASQLDTLLQDLKKEREISTREKDYALSSYTSGLETARSEARSPNLSGKRFVEDKLSVKRDIVYDPSSPQSSPRWNTSSPSERSHHFEKRIETTTKKDVSFDDKSEVRQTPTLSRSEKYIESRTVPPYFESTVTTHDLPTELADLKNVPLSDDILPVPGTKVTTTVRTYTYEIPAEPVPSQTTTKKLLYKREINENETNAYPIDRELPSTVTYKTESYRTTTDGLDHVPTPTVKSTKTIVRKQDVNESSSNVYVDRNVNVTNEYITDSTPLVDSNVYYRRDVTDTNRNTIDSPRSPPPTSSPVKPVTYYYKHHESTNTTNTLYGPPGDGQPSDRYYSPSPSSVQPSRPPYPAEPTTKTTKYSTYSSSHTRTAENEPLLHPAPFPTDNGIEPIGQVDTPPKRLDDLMASLGNENLRQTDIESHVSRREVETSVATAEKPPQSKNVAGPPVYYPPGREMFMKKEESSAAYRAGGGYARAAGKYEYEAESRSKSKSKSGAAVVPVCLPLCCAMPCSIM